MGEAHTGRRPGRSFENPRRPLGERVIREADEEAFAASDSAETEVADRAKAVAVLRKAEEFMATNNPSPATEAGRRRALELAAGRIGLTLAEYRAIVDADRELTELERKVLAASARGELERF